MRLNELSPGKGAKKVGKRKGRGHSAGQGKTSGRGVKGQKARSGGFHKVGFEGGQMPLYRRVARRGFSNYPFKKEFLILKVEALNVFKDGDTVNRESLVAKGLIRAQTHTKKTAIKILGNGTIEKKLTVAVDKVTSGAAEKIKAAGGTITPENNEA